MKTLIDKIERLKLGKESDYYNQGHDAAIRKIIDIIKSHPVIHAKALRKKGTDKWYQIDYVALDDGNYPFRTRRLPDLWHDDYRKDGIGFVAEANLPADAELVSVSIIVEDKP